MSTETPVPRRLQSDNGTIEGIIRPVWQRLNQKNEHWMHVIVGREGSGKSHTAIKICELIDPDFDASNVFFDPSSTIHQQRTHLCFLNGFHSTSEVVPAPVNPTH